MDVSRSRDLPQRFVFFKGRNFVRALALIFAVLAMIIGTRGVAGAFTPPVRISQPVSGATVSGSVNISCASSSKVLWVNFYVDGTKLASSPPYTINWNSTSVANGSHQISVNAYSSDNRLIGSRSETVYVANTIATPSPSPSPVIHFGTLPAHAQLPTGALCAGSVVPSSWEPRPENTQANNTIPTTAELIPFHAQPLNFSGGPPASDFQAVDGNYTGTTDMILRWAACKWGVDEDVLRAQALQESTWSSYTTGDLRTTQSQCEAGNWYGWQSGQGYCWQSYGIMQVKMSSYNAWPMAWDSTAFNADFRGAYWRACMNGDVQYYYGQTPSPGYPTYPNGTTDEMNWGCMGSWYSGSWYDSGSLGYIRSLQQLVSSKPWLTLPVGSSQSLVITAPANNQAVLGKIAIAINLNQSDPKACYACWSVDGVHQNCSPAIGPWTWDTRAYVLNGHHAIQVDAFTCSGIGPNYHAAENLKVAN